MQVEQDQVGPQLEAAGHGLAGVGDAVDLAGPGRAQQAVEEEDVRLLVVDHQEAGAGEEVAAGSTATPPAPLVDPGTATAVPLPGVPSSAYRRFRG